MTKRENFMELANIVKGLEMDIEKQTGLLDFITHELELLDRRKSGESKTKTQKEAEVLAEKVAESLAEIGSPITVTDFLKTTTCEELQGLSAPKITSLLKKLIEEGRVTRTVEKKRAFFSIVAEEV